MHFTMALEVGIDFKTYLTNEEGTEFIVTFSDCCRGYHEDSDSRFMNPTKHILILFKFCLQNFHMITSGHTNG
ncbi:protein of unknown function [Paenibacillus alvei]|uniref:Uncharacterized protein n=1 Tax=Paenibacillus alvei TaxID=44250 RepID=A0A383R6C9_PAEAL|nr:protein of unknown function [Paenibacillus alvei]